MTWLSALTFATPLALAALLALPVIWWLLRFTPPKPETVKFPPLRILLELTSKEQESDKTPWWLLLLRLAIAALLILGVSHPSYAPGRLGQLDASPLLLVVDDSWAAAGNWDKRQAVLKGILEEARTANAVASLATTTPVVRPLNLEPADPRTIAARAAALAPRALSPDYPAALAMLQKAFAASPSLRVIWMSDGLRQAEATAFAQGLAALATGTANVEVILPEEAELPVALAAPVVEGSRIKITALRVAQETPAEMKAVAIASNGRNLGDVPLSFAGASGKAEASFELPIELRNEVSRITLENVRNASAVFLLDDRWRRKTIALQSGAASEDAQPLLSPLYYVSRAIEPFGEVSEPADPRALKEALDAGLSMLLMADIGVIPGESQQQIADWVNRGGLLVRFAGPRLAGLEQGLEADPLIPVTLRQGGRSLGSALSWETPQAMQAFPASSPFAGLVLDNTVRVTRQVLAEPDADLPDRVWAVLEDGTPLVTARRQGKGTLVLFHVTANADWSNLPLTGLFVEMLRKLLDSAPAAGGGAAPGAASDGAEQSFVPRRALSGFGELTDPLPDTQPIALADIDKASVSARHPAGLYTRGAQERALNLSQAGDALIPVTSLPSGIAIRSLAPLPAMPLAPLAFAMAAILFLLDCLAALFLGGGLTRLRNRSAAAAMLALALLAPGNDALAQDADDYALRNALHTRLAYVLTGDSEIDRISEEGLRGLTAILRDRTSIEAAEPAAVDIARDDIVFFPLLYWPVRPEATVPSDAALAKIDAFMKNGGTIFFDLRDDGLGFDSLSGNVTASADALRRMLAKLDIPPLEPVPEEHVLTKSFYLMNSFPGRYEAGRLWVERPDAEGASSGNTDGVSSLIIGANDYAAAWAMDDLGTPLYAVIPGSDRQREYAYRAGINIVMYAMTGNYKADQVHVPALLERLGQ
jgi:hypothetical protein